jgi:hypothetical protein
MVPYGTYKIRNPWYVPHAPRAEDAKRVLSKVLTNTYNALNLQDENEVYDKLSRSVTGDLVAEIYLDSRRRLTAGTRKGAEVLVKDVSVISIEDTGDGTDMFTGFSYPCKWIVTARVKHMQHIHNRQNIYNGILTIKVDDDRWKIVGLELLSEERAILSWKSS